MMGCDSDPARHSTGQNIFAQKRPWVISTMESNLVIMNASQRIDIDTNGNYKISDLKTGEQTDELLDMNLLRQAMRHISRFIVRS
jgi:membrane-anchored protein YejM (alkaline phosphatase superfamily)